MKSIHIIAIIAISFVAGMFGGAFSERVFANPKVNEKIPEQVTARAFHLVDKNNQRRASMGFSRDGHPLLCVNDKDGKPRGYLGFSKDGPLLALVDKAGESNIILKANDDGSSILALMKDANHARLMMKYKPGSGPALGLYDDENLVKAFMSVQQGNPSINLLQGNQKPAISLLSDPQKGAMLAAWNSQGQHRLSFGLMHDKPILFAYNPDDTGLLFNTQRDGRPALGLLSDGSVVWSATGVAPQMPAMDGILDQILR